MQAKTVQASATSARFFFGAGSGRLSAPKPAYVPKPAKPRKHKHNQLRAKDYAAPRVMCSTVAQYEPRGVGGADNRWVGSRGAAGPVR